MDISLRAQWVKYLALVDTSGQLGLLLSSPTPGWKAGIQFKETGPGGKTFGIYSGWGGLHFVDVDYQGNDIMAIMPNGNIHVTGDVVLSNADCAEEFNVSNMQPIKPGTVAVIDDTGFVRSSQHAYDKRVAGVVSGAGEFRHAILLDKRSSDQGRVPIALMGKVYCKVDADCSPISVGDLLTTSPTPGHAMKATEAASAFGAVIGKALAPLAEGRGLIPILVALQ